MISAKILLLSLGGITTVGAIGGTSYYFIFKKNNEKPIDYSKYSKNDESDHAGERKLVVFPEVRMDAFYKYIRIKDGSPYISDEMIARLITYVVKNTMITDGNIKYYYEKISDTKAKVYFDYSLNHD